MNVRSTIGATVLMVAGLSGPMHAETYDITVMPFGLSEYMANWMDEMQQHPSVVDGTVKLTVLDGRFDANTQSNQMDTAVTRQADAVIFAPIDSDAATAPIERAAVAGVPVVASVTTATSDKLFADIATDNVEGGRLITEKMVEMLGGKGNVVLLEGPIGNSPQLLRREGIDAVLAENPDVELLASKTANWSRAEGLSVIAQNDEMALGAIQAIEAKGFTTGQIKVVAIDGIQDGLRAAKAGKLFTLYKPAHEEAQGAVDLAMRAIVGEGYEPRADVWNDADMRWQDGTGKVYRPAWVPVTPANVDQLLN